MNIDKYVHSDRMKNHQVEVPTDLLPATVCVCVCAHRSAGIQKQTVYMCLCVLLESVWKVIPS